MEKTLPINELRHLLYTVAEHGGQHLSEVEADLHHTSYLLGEAIEKLGVSFMAVHEAVMEQQKYLDKMIETHALPIEIKADIQNYRQHIGNEVDRVVTGLQFHDLTTQLNARTVKRVSGLSALFKQLLTEWDEMAMDFKYHEEQTIAALLTKMSESLGSGSQALEGGLRQPVKQQDMACGDIDLF